MGILKEIVIEVSYRIRPCYLHRHRHRRRGWRVCRWPCACASRAAARTGSAGRSLPGSTAAPGTCGLAPGRTLNINTQLTLLTFQRDFFLHWFFKFQLYMYYITVLWLRAVR